MLGKKLINSGPISSGANTFASENFNTVLYTGTGAAQKIGGYINRAAVFNGSSSVIQASGLNQFFNNWNDASWSAWINTTDTSAQYIACESTDSQNYKLIGSISSNKFQIIVRRSSTVYSGTSTTTMNDGNWHHIVATYQSSTGTVKGYIDGSEEISFSTGGTSSAIFSVYDFCIGANKQNSNVYNPLDGKMDQVRIFNKVLSSSEITTLYGETFASTTKSTTDIFSDNSGVALYQLDGNANAADDSGDLTHWAIVSDAGGNNMSCRLNSVYSEFTYTAPSGYSDWGGAWDTTSEVNTGGGSFSYSENNKKINESGGFYSAVKTVNGHKTGKYYFEVEYLSADLVVGLTRETTISAPFNDNAFKENAILRYTWTTTLSAYSTSNQTVGTAASVNDVYGFAVNFTDKEVSIYKNNTLVTTQNLLPDYFNGTASNITYQEATKFQPDLVWIKKRSSATNSDHMIFDSVRGADKVIISNSTQAEYNGGGTGYQSSFDSNGFTVTGNAFVNQNSQTFVSWCFNAGGGANTYNINGAGYSTRSAAGLTSGTIADSKFLGCSTNTAAGFSIIKYNGSGASAGQTIDTGLTSDIELMIIKRLDSTGNWVVVDSHTNKYHFLNTTAAGTNITFTDYVDGTKSKLYDFATFVHYCFHSVAGYQKIGTYQGSGVAGNMVETEFEPAFLMLKRTDSANDWNIFDNKRSTANPRNDVIRANLSNAEGVDDSFLIIDFVSNGFVLKGTSGGTNISGGNYIYLAIAADPDQTDPTVENSFDVVTYTGNRPSTQDIEVDFKPDLIWIKNRDSGSYPHVLTDSVRGNTKYLQSDDTQAEQTTTTGITSFNDNGFSLGANGYFNGGASGANNKMVAWCWKAGDHDDSIPQINTEGTIDSIVSVNDAAGFSIVKYIGNGTDNATVGTGLSSAAELVIVKDLNNTNYWVVGGSVVGNGKTLYLNDTSASLTRDRVKSVQSNTFTLGSHFESNGNGANFITYCWYSVTGHSKIGSYTGTGAAGNAQTLGFKPRFIMIKSTSNAEPWFLLDSQRNPTNPVNNRLMADSTASESANSVHTVDFTNTGFTANGTVGNGTNGNGVSYIYMAFK